MGLTDKRRLRIAAVLTHPTQYFSPWFRWLHANRPDVDFTAVYATAPDADRQGVGFGKAFQWDVPLLDGYPNFVLRPSEFGDVVHSSKFLGVDAPILPTLKRLKPDVALVFGWHSAFQIRTLVACRRLGVPVLYRGDTTLLQAPAGSRRILWSAKTKVLLHGGFRGYLAVGTRSREYLKAMGVSDSRIIHSPHCVDNEYFAGKAAASRRAGNPKARFGLEGKFVALFVGKLDDLKRPRDLLQAAARLGGDWAVLFVGGGPLERRLREEAARSPVTVSFAGFLNQSELGSAYAAGDVLVLPSAARGAGGHAETWGLVVNEALACGVPCVVSDGVGCAPDLIESGRTGEVHPRGDVSALANSLSNVRSTIERGEPIADQCRAKAARHSFEAASHGLIAGAHAIARRQSQSRERTQVRIVACLGQMAYVSGLERMSFAFLEAATNDGARVHAILNSWARDAEGRHLIEPLCDRIGATTSVGFYWWPLDRATFTSKKFPVAIYDILATSCGFLYDSIRVRPTCAFVPDFMTAMRNFPALFLLRCIGVRTVLRLGNSVHPGRFYQFVWRHPLNAIVDLFVANSDFTRQGLLDAGVSPRKIVRVYNKAPERANTGSRCVERDPSSIVFVGQLIPPKGVHLLLDAAGILVAKGLRPTVRIVGNLDQWEAPTWEGYKDGLRTRAAMDDLKGRVEFLGYRDDVPGLLAAAAVQCLPSMPEMMEGFGLAVLEAKHAGTPSVVFGPSAPAELVRHRIDGWVFKEPTAASLAEGLEYFLVNPERARRAGEAARASTGPFNAERFAREAAAVFARRRPVGSRPKPE